MTDSIMREARKLATDALVKLYEIDATELGGDVFRFCSSIDDSVPIDSITPAGPVCTVVSVRNHLLDDGDSVRISNADDPLYNGDFVITLISPTSFSYVAAGSPVAPATGAYLVGTRLNHVLKFDGESYTPIEMDVNGFEWNGQGSQPTPTLQISNKHRTLASLVREFNNLRGAKFIRTRTFRKHLDDGSDPDADMVFPREVYRINRKAAQNKIFMEFEIATALDQEGVQIPGQQCLKDTCTHRYRVWDAVTETFDYSKATCPYTGPSYFTRNNTATANASEDFCSKQLKGCTDRFGDAPLPTRAIPGIGGR